MPRKASSSAGARPPALPNRENNAGKGGGPAGAEDVARAAPTHRHDPPAGSRSRLSAAPPTREASRPGGIPAMGIAGAGRGGGAAAAPTAAVIGGRGPPHAGSPRAGAGAPLASALGTSLSLLIEENVGPLRAAVQSMGAELAAAQRRIQQLEEERDQADARLAAVIERLDSAEEEAQRRDEIDAATLAQKQEQRRRWAEDTAARAVAKMGNSLLGRAMQSWGAPVMAKRQRLRTLRKAVQRMRSLALAQTFGPWCGLARAAVAARAAEQVRRQLPVAAPRRKAALRFCRQPAPAPRAPRVVLMHLSEQCNAALPGGAAEAGGAGRASQGDGEAWLDSGSAAGVAAVEHGGGDASRAADGARQRRRFAAGVRAGSAARGVEGVAGAAATACNRAHAAARVVPLVSSADAGAAASRLLPEQGVGEWGGADPRCPGRWRWRLCAANMRSDSGPSMAGAQPWLGESASSTSSGVHWAP